MEAYLIVCPLLFLAGFVDSIAGGGGLISLPAYLLAPDVEEKIRGSIRQTTAGSYMALDPATAQRFVSRAKQSIGALRQGRSRPVIVVSMDIRRYVRKLIEMELYDVPVLSYQELTQEITVQPLDRITL